MEQQKINKTPEKTKDNNYRTLTNCPYCGATLIKRGKRKKKYETIQLYYCKHCKKKITSAITKNKTYPLKVIIDSLTLYNKLTPLNTIPELIKEKYGITITSRIISKWLDEFKQYIPFLRMREFVSKKYNKKDLIEESKLIHQQIYHFKYHRAKLELILNEQFKHFKFKPLKQFLELVNTECPHQLFKKADKRASEYKDKFNLDQVKITPKTNTAIKLANFIIQAVSKNKLRHETLQDFMLFNDSTTVAVEVPILLNSEDIRHYKHELNFDIPINLKDGQYITGHIDFVQVRNGSIHILDYKPSAKKQKPIAQLTLYALALSRLTGIRLFHFKCAWFDKENYFEFFPLHVVYKLKNKKRIDKKQTRLK